MNSMLIIASLIAVAVATPVHRGLITPGAAGPAPIIIEPTQPIAVGPTPIVDDSVPISIGSAMIDFEPVEDVPAVELTPAIPTGTPLVQIILNINAAGEIIGAPVINPTPTPVATEVIAPGPVNVVDGPVVSPIAVVAPEAGAVNIVEGGDVAPEVTPVAVGTPILPEAIIPVAVGTPVLPTPVAVLPEILN